MEGIVPTNHESAQLAGLASFPPTFCIREFIDFAERVMLEQIIDGGLFEKVVEMKERRDQQNTAYGREKEFVHEINIDDSDPMNNIKPTMTKSRTARMFQLISRVSARNRTRLKSIEKFKELLPVSGRITHLRKWTPSWRQ